MVYASTAISSNSSIQLTRGGCILIGLLSGGDYHGGLHGCGHKLAHGLARAGLGDDLLNGTQHLDEDDLPEFLDEWRERLRTELKTDAHGFLGRKCAKLSKEVPEDFPNPEVLRSYTHPITSESEGRKVDIKWDKDPDLGKIAGLCELYFEWGVKDVIVKRFRTVLWPGAVLRLLRRAALNGPGAVSGLVEKKTEGAKASRFASRSAVLAAADSDESDEDDDDDNGGGPLLIKIHSSRRHASTDALLEYRLEIAPLRLVRQAEAGVKGIRPPIEIDSAFELDDDDGEEGSGGANKGKKAPLDPASCIRMWAPACIVELACPDLVKDFEDRVGAKATKKATKAAGTTKRAKSRAKTASSDDEDKLAKFPSLSPLAGTTPAPPSRAQSRAPTASQSIVPELQAFPTISPLAGNTPEPEPVGRPRGRSTSTQPPQAPSSSQPPAAKKTKARATPKPQRPPPALSKRSAVAALFEEGASSSRSTPSSVNAIPEEEEENSDDLAHERESGPRGTIDASFPTRKSTSVEGPSTSTKLTGSRPQPARPPPKPAFIEISSDEDDLPPKKPAPTATKSAPIVPVITKKPAPKKAPTRSKTTPIATLQSTLPPRPRNRPNSSLVDYDRTPAPMDLSDNLIGCVPSSSRNERATNLGLRTSCTSDASDTNPIPSDEPLHCAVPSRSRDTRMQSPSPERNETSSPPLRSASPSKIRRPRRPSVSDTSVISISDDEPTPPPIAPLEQAKQRAAARLAAGPGVKLTRPPEKDLPKMKQSVLKMTNVKARVKVARDVIVVDSD